MRTRLFVTLASIAAFAYACGGVDSASISGSGGDDDDTSATHDAGSRDASVTGRDGGGPIADGGGGGDDAGGGKRDGGGPKDSGGGGSVIPALCGTTLTCTSASPTCCASQGSSSTSYACTASAGACSGPSGTLAIACRDDRDCNGGKVCCADYPLTGSVYTSLRCVSASECPVVDDAGAATDFVRFCTPTVADSCPGLGQTCNPSNVLPGFNRCY